MHHTAHAQKIVFQTAEGKYLQTVEGKYLKLCSKWSLSGWPRNVKTGSSILRGFLQVIHFWQTMANSIVMTLLKMVIISATTEFFILFSVVSSTLNDIEPYPCNFVSSKLNRKDEPSAHYKWPFSMVISKLAEVVSCMLGFRRFAEAWKFWCFRPPAGAPEAPEAPEALAVQLLQIQSSSSTLLRKSNLTYRKRRTGQFFLRQSKIFGVGWMVAGSVNADPCKLGSVRFKADLEGLDHSLTALQRSVCYCGNVLGSIFFYPSRSSNDCPFQRKWQRKEIMNIWYTKDVFRLPAC